MAGISVTLEGSNIQLAFEKNDHTTAIVMDASTAQSLLLALGQMLLRIDTGDDGQEGDGDEDEDGFEGDEFLDVSSPSIDIGTDERGQPVVALQPGPLPPMLLRLDDDEARTMAQSLLEILSSPQDVRASQGDH